LDRGRCCDVGRRRAILLGEDGGRTAEGSEGHRGAVRVDIQPGEPSQAFHRSLLVSGVESPRLPCRLSHAVIADVSDCLFLSGKNYARHRLTFFADKATSLACGILDELLKVSS
ncbi:hypothetical protein BHE74_00008646, partial [Ensete ventricosum]